MLPTIPGTVPTARRLAGRLPLPSALRLRDRSVQRSARSRSSGRSRRRETRCIHHDRLLERMSDVRARRRCSRCANLAVEFSLGRRPAAAARRRRRRRSRSTTRETVGLVGESGSGKSTIGRAILGLAPVAEGTIRFAGDDITHAGYGERRRAEPRSAGRLPGSVQLAEPDADDRADARRDAARPRAAARLPCLARVASMLERVGLGPEAADRYPSQLLRRSAPADRDRARADGAPAPRRSATSRSARSTSRCRRRFSTSCASSRTSFGLELPLHRARPRRSSATCRIGSSCCTAAGSWSRVRRRRSTKRLRTRTRARCSMPRRCPIRGCSASAGQPAKAASRPISYASSAEGCPFVARCAFAIERCGTVRPELETTGRGSRVACHRWRELRLEPVAPGGRASRD